MRIAIPRQRLPDVRRHQRCDADRLGRGGPYLVALPHLTNVELRQLLIESAVDLGAPGRDDAFGWGRVDALRALRRPPRAPAAAMRP